MVREAEVQSQVVITKTQKMVLDAALLSTQHYKVRIKGKVELYSTLLIIYTYILEKEWTVHVYTKKQLSDFFITLTHIIYIYIYNIHKYILDIYEHFITNKNMCFLKVSIKDLYNEIY